MNDVPKSDLIERAKLARAEEFRDIVRQELYWLVRPDMDTLRIDMANLKREVEFLKGENFRLNDRNRKLEEQMIMMHHNFNHLLNRIEPPASETPSPVPHPSS